MPIEAGPANEIHRLSNFIYIVLKHLKKREKIICYINDFLNQFPGTVEANSCIVSFDIDNITRDLGMEAIEYWLQKYTEEIKGRIS